MNTETKNFLSILNSVLHNTALSLTEPVDYGVVFSLAMKHNVYPLVCEKLYEDPEIRGTQIYADAAVKTVGAVASQTMRTEAFLRLYRAFSEAGVHPLVMKGIVCRQLYGSLCDHRPSGDEDILVQSKDYPLAEQVLTAQGYCAEWDAMTQKQLGEIQEVTFYHPDNGLHIEVHTNPIGRENTLRRQMNDYFADVFEHARTMSVNGTEICTMNHTDHFLFLLLHAFKHMMTGGFGIRQVMDILLYDAAYQNEIEWEEIYRCLREVGAEQFFADIIEIGNRYLGFELTAEADTNCPEDLLEDLLNNGIFGGNTQAHRTALSMTSAAVSGRERPNKLKTLWKTILPNREFMTGQNPELADKPWLLPVCWIRRWMRFLKHNRAEEGNLAAESMAISGRRIELLKKYGVIKNS